jgi:hypothetical protein
MQTNNDTVDNTSSGQLTMQTKDDKDDTPAQQNSKKRLIESTEILTSSTSSSSSSSSSSNFSKSAPSSLVSSSSTPNSSIYTVSHTFSMMNRSVHHNLRALQVGMTEFRKNTAAWRADISERAELVKLGPAWARCLQRAKDDTTPYRSDRDKLLFALPENNTVISLPGGDFAGIIKLGDAEIIVHSFPTVLEAAISADYGTTFLRPHEIEQTRVLDALRCGIRELAQIAIDMNEAFSFTALLAPGAPRLNFPGSASDCRICPPVDPWPPIVLLAWDLAQKSSEYLIQLGRPLPTLPTRSDWILMTISPYFGLESIHNSIGLWLPPNMTFEKLFFSNEVKSRKARLLSSSASSAFSLSQSHMSQSVQQQQQPYQLRQGQERGDDQELHSEIPLLSHSQFQRQQVQQLQEVRSLAGLLLPPPLLYLTSPDGQIATSTTSEVKVKSEIPFDKTAIRWLIENKKIEPASENDEDDNEGEEIDEGEYRMPDQPDGDQQELK